MPVFLKNTPLIQFLSQSDFLNASIGFVPTMGALHQGHLSLMQESLKENDITVVSVFVNPTQFNNPLDLKNYPRTLEKDQKAIADLNPNIIIYAPTVDEVYQNGLLTKQHFDFDGLENQMEGASRPGHFDGVGTVVKRLFEIVKPKRAYFGEKDFQQLQIIKKLVLKNNIPVEIIGCTISREKNGLAMSSRNALLSENARETAAIVFETLQKAKIIFIEKGITEAKSFVKTIYDKRTDFILDYFEIADEQTLKPCLQKESTKKYRAFIAVFIENVRLIDTIAL
jgi:pantoate--beta-alanine ligase